MCAQQVLEHSPSFKHVHTGTAELVGVTLALWDTGSKNLSEVVGFSGIVKEGPKLVNTYVQYGVIDLFLTGLLFLG